MCKLCKCIRCKYVHISAQGQHVDSVARTTSRTMSSASSHLQQAACPCVWQKNRCIHMFSSVISHVASVAMLTLRTNHSMADHLQQACILAMCQCFAHFEHVLGMLRVLPWSTSGQSTALLANCSRQIDPCVWERVGACTLTPDAQHIAVLP